MSIHFTKMHGLGNDFMVINALKQPINLSALSIPQLADRHLGVGFDQLLLIEASTNADFFCKIFNADGSEAEQCGNGLRCVARFIHEEKLHPQSTLTIETKAGVFAVSIPDYDHIRITLNAPVIQEKLMPFPLTNHAESLEVCILSLGNPHAIIKVEALEAVPFKQLGSTISTHPYFPNGANVGFMQIMNPHHIRLKTFERGSGETHACGSNACAAAVAGILNGWLTSPVQVEFRYGSLTIEWEKNNSDQLHMTGPAVRVFSGVV